MKIGAEKWKSLKIPWLKVGCLRHPVKTPNQPLTARWHAQNKRHVPKNTTIQRTWVQVVQMSCAQEPRGSFKGRAVPAAGQIKVGQKETYSFPMAGNAALQIQKIPHHRGTRAKMASAVH